MLVLNFEKREKESKLGEIRDNNKIPAIYYGPKNESTSISVDKSDFLKIYKKAGESTVISLKSGSGESIEAIIHEIDTNPVTNVVRHVDFYVPEKGKTIHVKIPLDFIGISPAIKNLGGTLVKVLHELEIEVLPSEMPQSIEVDISSIIDFETHLLIKNLKLPKGTKALMEENEVVALVAPPKEEIETEKETQAPDLENIEVKKKGKENKEEEKKEDN